MQPTTQEGGAMPKKTKVSTEMLESATEAAREAKTSDEFRMAQAVLFPAFSTSLTALRGRSLVVPV